MDSLNQIVTQNIGLFVVVLGVLGLAALVVGFMGLKKVGTMSRRFAWATGADSQADTLPALLSSVESSVRRIGELETSLRALAGETRTHFKHAGLVRYDAFEGVAGQQSYSLCLLDDMRNGILISNVVGNNFNRGYAIEIHNGTASRKLGDEEVAAIASATRASVPAQAESEALLTT